MIEKQTLKYLLTLVITISVFLYTATFHSSTPTAFTNIALLQILMLQKTFSQYKRIIIQNFNKIKKMEEIGSRNKKRLIYLHSFQSSLKLTFSLFVIRF